ncbi:hypothetical protein STEG23_011715 [Scotinomys teguina]
MKACGPVETPGCCPSGTSSSILLVAKETLTDTPGSELYPFSRYLLDGSHSKDGSRPYGPDGKATARGEKWLWKNVCARIRAAIDFC